MTGVQDWATRQPLPGPAMPVSRGGPARNGAGVHAAACAAKRNQTQRAVAAGTYVLTYNVENQLVRVSGPATAAFSR